MLGYKISCAECRHLGKTNRSISRKEWVRNWREVVCWERYYDHQIIDIEYAVAEYCKRNDIPFDIDGGWLRCASNRYHYNSIMKLIDEVLYEDHRED